jgi:hypothetical protein
MSGPNSAATRPRSRSPSLMNASQCCGVGSDAGSASGGHVISSNVRAHARSAKFGCLSQGQVVQADRRDTRAAINEPPSRVRAVVTPQHERFAGPRHGAPTERAGGVIAPGPEAFRQAIPETSAYRRRRPRGRARRQTSRPTRPTSRPPRPCSPPRSRPSSTPGASPTSTSTSAATRPGSGLPATSASHWTFSAAVTRRNTPTMCRQRAALGSSARAEPATTRRTRQSAAGIERLAWTEHLTTCRPFLAHSDLEAMFDGKPSDLCDRLAAVLGLGDLTAAQDRMRDQRRFLVHRQQRRGGAADDPPGPGPDRRRACSSQRTSPGCEGS